MNSIRVPLTNEKKNEVNKFAQDHPTSQWQT